MDLKITSNPYKSKRGNQDIEKIKRLNQSMLMMNTNQLTETSAPPGCETFSWSTQKEDPCEIGQITLLNTITNVDGTARCRGLFTQHFLMGVDGIMYIHAN